MVNSSALFGRSVCRANPAEENSQRIVVCAHRRQDLDAGQWHHIVLTNLLILRRFERAAGRTPLRVVLVAAGPHVIESHSIVARRMVQITTAGERFKVSLLRLDARYDSTADRLEQWR